MGGLAVIRLRYCFFPGLLFLRRREAGGESKTNNVNMSLK
jgi:hypothetical protein